MSDIEEEIPPRSANDSPTKEVRSDQEDLERRLLEAADGNQEQEIHDLMKENVNIDVTNSIGETPLHRASRYGYFGVVEALLNYPLSINATDNDGWTALYGAAKNGNIDIVTLLLRPGTKNSAADPNIPDTDGWTPLYVASSEGGEGYLNIVEKLLDSGAKIDHENDNGQTALQNASCCGHLNTVKKLLESGAAVDYLDHDEWTALQYASTYGHSDVVKELLGSKAAINHVSKDGWTALNKACENGYEDVVRVLLEHEASIEQTSNDDDMNALHIAASEGYHQIVDQLLQKKADPSARTTRKDTALHLAASNGEVEVVKLLLGRLNESLQSAFKAKNDDQETAWSIAIKKQNKDVVEQFLKYPESIDLDVADNPETLIWSVKQKNICELVELVLKKRKRKMGKDIDDKLQKLRPKDVWEPLHWAVYHGDYSLVWLLLRSNGTDEKAEKVRTSAKTMADTIHKDIKKSRPSLRGPSDNKRQKDLAAQDSKSKDGGPEEKTPKDPKTQDKIQKDLVAEEKKYSEILGILTHPDMLYDPEIVELSDFDKPYKKPSLGPVSSDDIASFHVGILDFYQKDERYGLLRRSRDVQTVIYTDGPESIMDSARKALKKVESEERAYDLTDLKLRWIHIPANNMRWMTDLVSRIYADSKEQPRQKFHEMERFLQQSWHQLPSGEAKRRHMKPTCRHFTPSISMGREGDTSSTSSSRSVHEDDTSSTNSTRSPPMETMPEPTAESLCELALYMPYLTFSTLTNEELVTEKDQQQRRSEDSKAENVGKARGNNNKEKIKQGKTEEPRDTTHQELNNRREHEVKSQKQDPENLRKPVPSLNLVPIPETKAYRTLLETYKNEKLVTHGSRTLDEAHYHSLANKAAIDDLNSRNKDQVVSRRVNLLREKENEPWTILRVDQLWLWVIDKKTVISCSTHRVDEKKDPVLEEIWERLRNEMSIGAIQLQTLSAYEMAKLITDFCIEFFDHATCSVGNMNESIRQIFENSINNMASKEAELFDKFTRKIDDFIEKLERRKTLVEKGKGKKEHGDELKTKKENEKEENEDEHSDESIKQRGDEKVKMEYEAIAQAKTNLESIKEASVLLKEIKDIRDELNILKSILTQQKKVWSELRRNSARKNGEKRPAYIINDIEEMDNQASRIQEAVASILNLEQNEASISEAISSREQAQESIQQGRTLMLFTVVTIVFLPLSFLASLFALNISSFPRSDGNVLYSPGWIFPIIFGVTTVISVPLVLLAYIDAVRRHFFIWRENMRENIGKISLQKAISMLQAQLKKLSQIKQTTNGSDDGKEADRGTPRNTVPLSAALKSEYHRIKAKRPLFRRKRIEAESDSTTPASPGEGKATKLDV